MHLKCARAHRRLSSVATTAASGARGAARPPPAGATASTRALRAFLELQSRGATHRIQRKATGERQRRSLDTRWRQAQPNHWYSLPGSFPPGRRLAVHYPVARETSPCLRRRARAVLVGNMLLGDTLLASAAVGNMLQPTDTWRHSYRPPRYM